MSSVIYTTSPPYNITTVPATYVVYTPDTGANFYARNGRTGAADASGVDPRAIEQAAIDAL